MKRQDRGPRPDAAAEDLITLGDAAALVGKTKSNISYLVQYERLQRYDPSGKVVSRAHGRGLRVSRTELLTYVDGWNRRLEARMKKLNITDTSIAFLDVPERERTKHVHRLHPYLGKFIPQLAGYFLAKFLRPREVVLDPFAGSGTTLVEASEKGIDSVGVELSEFNVMICRTKTARYDLSLLKEEVTDILQRTSEYSATEFGGEKGKVATALSGEGGYLEKWFAARSLGEMLYYRDQIPRYEQQDLLKVLLSRTARSCRLVHHYDLATPAEPVRGPYVCYKHKGRVCTPLTTILPRLKFYSGDTLRRVAEFERLRKQATAYVVEGDARTVRLGEEVESLGGPRDIEPKGVFTSPPYVGQIDYHEQHRYAYELFGIGRRDRLEIGPKARGKGEKAQREYVDGMVETLRNVGRGLRTGTPVFLVANDRLGLYPEIFEQAEMRVERSYERPVEDRTERDKRPYSETVFLARVG